MHKLIVFSVIVFFITTAQAQIDIDYALDDGRLSQKANILSLSLDDALRGELGIYYTREFRSLDISFGFSKQYFKPLKPDFYILDMYREMDILSFSNAVKFSFAYDQIIQSIENYGFSFRIHAQQFYYEPTELNYQSISFASGFLFKPVMNNNWYINSFIGLGAVLYESELGKSGLSAYMAIECKLGYKFKF